MGFLETVRASQRITSAEVGDVTTPSGQTVSSLIYLQETTGTKHPGKFDDSQSTPVDVLIAIPVIHVSTDASGIGTSDSLDILELPLHTWEAGIYPIAFNGAAGFTFEFTADSIRLISDRGELHMPANLTPAFRQLMKRLGCFTLLVENQGSCTGATFSNEAYPTVGLLRSSLAHSPRILDQLLRNPRSVSPVIIEKLDLLLDRATLPDVSEYRTYKADRRTTTLPQLKWSTYCVCCKAEEVTREHCTPAWLCNLLGVEPIVSKIFCSSCNSYFGETLENPIKQLCQGGEFPRELSAEALSLMSRWFVKTALTTALASGVRLDLSWFAEIRENSIPDGLVVEFSPTIRTDPADPLYTYGVSHFSRKLMQHGTFLFTFACPYFSFFVRRSDPPMRAPFMTMIWPQFNRKHCEAPQVESLADLHEVLYVRITREEVAHIPIIGRNASPRS